MGIASGEAALSRTHPMLWKADRMEIVPDIYRVGAPPALPPCTSGHPGDAKICFSGPECHDDDDDVEGIDGADTRQ